MERLGTKLRALYQRKKGRDHFDPWHAIEGKSVSPERVVTCFERYMLEGGSRVTRAVYEENLLRKLLDKAFRADIAPLLRPGMRWDIDRAAATILEVLISRLTKEPSRGHD